MPSSNSSGVRPLLLIALVAAVALSSALLVRQRMTRKLAQAQPTPATTPTTQTTQTAVKEEPKPPRSYLELIEHKYPAYPSTQPLSRAVDHRYAGHFEMSDRIHLDTLGRLWITRSDAEPTETLLAPKLFPQAIITRERPVFVHWPPTTAAIDAPILICPTSASDGFEAVNADRRYRIGQASDYDWARAVSWREKVLVPTSKGLSIFTFTDRGGATESRSPSLIEADETHASVLYAFDAAGVIAWMPPRENHPGSAGAVRFVDGNWTRLTPDAGWPPGIIHLIPLLDGSVMQIIAADANTVRLAVATLDTVNVDERAVVALVFKLSDPDSTEREKAFRQLAAFGPGAWPIIQRLMDDQPPDARTRLRDLMRSRVEPLLGHMQIVGNRLRLISRFPDGGAFFFAERGVALPRGDEQPEIVPAAYVSLRPGQLVRLMDPELVRDFDPEKQTLTPWYDEWIVSDEVRGPRRFLGNTLLPMLRKTEVEAGFTRFVGMDRAGRYLFRKATLENHPTLIVDPYLPDPAPRLPVWEIAVDGTISEVGWDNNHFPAMKQGGAWALGERDWRPLKEDKGDQFLTSAADVPPVADWTPPTTNATTNPSSLPSERPIHVDAEGNAYFDGKQTLRVVRRDGTAINWELPPHATGEATPLLVRGAHNRLFLFNEPGRLLRIAPSPAGEEPFTIEATFTHKIPNVEVTRMWLDPAGRLIFAHEATLTICFPEGYIPPAITNLMPVADQDDQIED